MTITLRQFQGVITRTASIVFLRKEGEPTTQGDRLCLRERRVEGHDFVLKLDGH
jgi:hypothetical protein